MTSICGLDCCGSCPLKGQRCQGCAETNGHPCDGSCTAAAIILSCGWEAFARQKAQIIAEVNALGIPDLQISDLTLLNGSYINLAYDLPSGQRVKLLDDAKVYFGNQTQRPGTERCYGIAADENYLLVSEYGPNGAEPQILVFQKRSDPPAAR